MDNTTELQIMKQRLEALESAYNRNNFEGSQDFNKASRFNTSLQVPVYASNPTVGQVGELYVNSVSGKLYVCTATNTWVVAGTQT
jgi:hypothetical protein